MNSWQDWAERLAPYQEYVLLGLLALAVSLAAILAAHRRRARIRTERLAYTQRVLNLVQPEAGLENNLNLILEIIGSIVKADGYAFYIQESKSKSYVLKSVRHGRRDPGQAAPAYGGLAPYKKEVYLPPLSIRTESSDTGPEFIREGEVPLFHLPLGEGNGVIRIGPIAKIPNRELDLLLFVADLLPKLLGILIESERLRTKADVVETSSAALHAVSSMAMDAETVVRKAFGMSAIALGMSEGCLFVTESGNVSVMGVGAMSKEKERKLRDVSTATMIIQLIGARKLVTWEEDGPSFDQIRSLLGNTKDRYFVGGQFPLPGKKAWYICAFPPSLVAESSASQLQARVALMVQELGRLIEHQNSVKPFGQSFSGFLKKLANTIDNLNPYTIGYSEMMSRYAIIIAKEMGLPAAYARSVGLAAYLSNIGVLGLSEDLYLKEGKFTEAEFETMKLHCEVGAAIVEMTIGSKEVADCIRYHHERTDGNGYPAGLRGDAIPVGARIIAVVQTFLAKINGRKYREPLSFDKALNMLESIAGSQLDAECVHALIRWFDKKRTSALARGRSLGPCWEMCCSPPEVCETCPAFRNVRQNCWELPTNNCQAHGKSCASCFVYTETTTRSGVG